MILLDTVVVSELRKPKANPAVIAYLRAQNPAVTFISTLTLGEIEAGVQAQRLVNPDHSTQLSHWLSGIELQFAQNVLPITTQIAKLWGRLTVTTGNKGVDNLIAATALVHNLTVVTRNIKHFAPTGVRTLNPFV